MRKGIETLIDITRIPDLDQITIDEDEVIHLGPLVTHNHCVEFRLIRARAYPLARAAWEVGAPQIRNRGTIAGNLITASPANDTITPLMALNASVTLQSTRGTRTVPLQEFYKGVRKTVMQPDEMLVDISFPAMSTTARGTFLKLALRRAQAISVVDVAVILDMEKEAIKSASITLGAVTPVIPTRRKRRSIWPGNRSRRRSSKRLRAWRWLPRGPSTMSAGRLPIAVRWLGSAPCAGCGRSATGRNTPGCRQSRSCYGAGSRQMERLTACRSSPASPIETTINGKPYTFHSGHDKTLLRLLREEANLIGTKEGCAEGECGACTVFLDGKAVMACLVPAPRAHGAEIVTVEGLSVDGELHPVQEAFIEHGAVQCGYCTPGFLMSSAMLLEEKSNPTRNEIEQAITGNLCRCTGYYKIVQAIEDAGSG